MVTSSREWPKCPEEMSFNERRFDVIAHLFIDPADQDYLASRWAYDNALLYAANWSAAQALEKYMKAFLLLNDQPVKKQAHNLDLLFEQTCLLDNQELLPRTINMPPVSGQGRDDLDKRATSEFVSYLNVFGSADNRYGLRGTKHAWPVLHPLDQICAALRRAMRTSNFFAKDLLAVSFEPDQRCLKLYPNWMISLGLRLERCFLGKRQVGDRVELRQVFLNMNFAFVGADGEPELSEPGTTFGGTIISMDRLRVHLVEAKKRDQSKPNLDEVGRLRDWVAGNIFMDKATRARIGL